MIRNTPNPEMPSEAQDSRCATAQSGFSDYLDGAISGVDMAAISSHLETCTGCSDVFNALRQIQRSLGELGPAQPPVRLQAQLRAAVAVERERGAHLPFHKRFGMRWKDTIAPVTLRLSGGIAAAVMVVGCLSWMFGAPIVVQANDDGMAQLVAPRYLYSQMPPEAIHTHRDVAIVVEAMVDSDGRVYDYSILEGPHDRNTQVMVEDNLLGSVFRPATVFGVPVRGHVVMTYTGVSVRG